MKRSRTENRRCRKGVKYCLHPAATLVARLVGVKMRKNGLAYMLAYTPKAVWYRI